jgi:hypothetical protein
MSSVLGTYKAWCEYLFKRHQDCLLVWSHTFHRSTVILCSAKTLSMTKISLSEWKTILVDNQNNVENAWDRQNPWTGSAWKAALAQVKVLAAVPKGTFRPNFPVPSSETR